MRILLLLLAVSFLVSACGKKAPLRPPEPPQQDDQEQ